MEINQTVCSQSSQVLPETQETSSQLFDQSIIDENIWGRLFSISHKFRNTVIDLTEDKYSFGRGNVSIRFTEKMFDMSFLTTISKTHFFIYRERNAKGDFIVVLEDNSFNGTYINKIHIGRGKRKVLRNNDEISLTLPAKRVFVFYDCFQNDGEDYPTCLTEKYTVTSKLGDGSFGEVRLAYAQGTLNRVAVKIVKKKILSTNGTTFRFNMNQINNEVELLRSVDHPCIVKLLEIIEGPENIYIVMELAEGGELFDRIVTKIVLKEDIVKLYFYQLVQAVKYLHDRKITHRDIKPENILLDSDDEQTIVKLTDFGLSKLTLDTSIMTSLCGTPAYIAPEVLIHDEKRFYNSKVDMWSLGCVLFVCLAGYPPFNGETDQVTRLNIKTGNYKMKKDIWSRVSEQATDLMKKLLVVNPDVRLSAEQVLKHKWLQDPQMMQAADKLMYPPIQSSPPKRRVEDTSEDIISSKTPKLMSGVEFNLM